MIKQEDYPVYHDTEYEYVGIAYPWHVIEVKDNHDCPERRLLAYLKLINDVSGKETYYEPLLPVNSYPKAE